MEELDKFVEVLRLQTGDVLLIRSDEISQEQLNSFKQHLKDRYSIDIAMVVMPEGTQVSIIRKEENGDNF